PPRLVKPLGKMNQRAASYARNCTALQVAPGECSILADHRILPLSRTRDAYWQACLLLATWSRGGHDDDARIVADHLRWLYLRCERPDGRWLRSHHADGRRKDHPFQADQQLYPILELLDYVAATGGLPDLPPDQSWGQLVQNAWTAAGTAIDAGSGLISSDENPAGDVPRYPYLVSNQVLLWYVSSRLAGVAERLGLARTPLLETAARTRAAVDAHFLVDGPLGRQWAYAVNARGGAERYVDATDLPVALAPLWGFCKPSAPAWRTTMRFAFDAENPAYVAGVAGGLGSRHTPGTWTLGDIMGWVAFGLMGERDASDAALARLVAAAFTDGMLPEAYDPDGSGSAVRHWFAWPGAALGRLVLEHAAR
ncbi:MAG TPA: glycoside hydrolase family 125 protein, partial [Candidatus Limnocylindrales bacterium]|nr:glycoside hydrolase family 125 protein [Candidatus Limnocylindrales bacterium]